MNTTAEQLVARGQPQQALDALQREVREHAADPKLRVFLFQLLSVLGQWPRALNQLQLCGEMDAGTLAMVSTYREALQCEMVREAVFGGRTTPMVLGEPQPWVALLVKALQCDAQGDPLLAQRLRADAFEAAPTSSGSVNDEDFEWIADADSRLGPVLEAVVNGRYCWIPFAALSKVTIEPPTDLRDLVWAPAQLTLANEGGTVALIPSRYVGSGGELDGGVQLSRKTEWVPLGAEQYRGLGQRVLTTEARDIGLLEVRTLVLHQPSSAASLH